MLGLRSNHRNGIVFAYMLCFGNCYNVASVPGLSILDCLFRFSITFIAMIIFFTCLKIQNIKWSFIVTLRIMVFNATFNNISVISWRSVLLVDETGVPGENHRPVASHWQTKSLLGARIPKGLSKISRVSYGFIAWGKCVLVLIIITVFTNFNFNNTYYISHMARCTWYNIMW
jgi:hypothetical protein